MILSVLLLSLFSAAGQGRMDTRLTPKWLGGQNDSRFKVIRLDQPSLSPAAGLGKLVERLGDDWNVSQSTQLQNYDILERENGRMASGHSRQVSQLDIIADGKPVSVRCMLADEWVSRKGGGYYALYQVADAGRDFVPFHITDRYGATPVFLSLIPGVGQFYKGDALKGSLFLGGCALGGAGVVFLESQRKACISQQQQTHDVNLLKQYSADERNYSIARNIVIGITAALYLYNLIDAGAAPGARRLVVDSNGIRYSF